MNVTLPTKALPTAFPVGTGWMPVIYHPDRPATYVQFERFPRKAKATATEAIGYAMRVVWYRQMRAAEKRRRLEAISHPRYWQDAGRAA